MSPKGSLLACAAFTLLIGCHPAPAASKPSTAGAAEPPSAGAEKRALHARGIAAYGAKEYAACGPLLERALDFYDAACCYAQAGVRDSAFAMLERAVDQGLHDADLAKDSDLDPLHADPRWQHELDHAAAAAAEHRKTLNGELTRLFVEDQADRALPYEQIDWTKVTPRDQERRRRVDEILATGARRAADDYYHAAMVYQHGKLPEEIQRAHDLAVKAAELDENHNAARWLAAASEDRKLMYLYQPQRWGTQFKKVDGKWIVWPVDPAITDAQRAEWNVPPLAASQAAAARMNAAK